MHDFVVIPWDFRPLPPEPVSSGLLHERNPCSGKADPQSCLYHRGHPGKGPLILFQCEAACIGDVIGAIVFLPDVVDGLKSFALAPSVAPTREGRGPQITS